MTKSLRAGEDITEPTDSPTAPTAVSHTRHTPGPWRAAFGDNDEWEAQPGEGDCCIACLENPALDAIDVYGPERTEWTVEEHYANARLIAAAPDLLAALVITRGQWIHSVNAEQCLAAIAKAEGN